MLLPASQKPALDGLDWEVRHMNVRPTIGLILYAGVAGAAIVPAKAIAQETNTKKEQPQWDCSFFNKLYVLCISNGEKLVKLFFHHYLTL